MNRRGFLGLLGGAIAGIALDAAIPFNRVWSFPSQIIVAPRGNIFLDVAWVTRESLMILKNNFDGAGIIGSVAGFDWDEEVVVGSTFDVRRPTRYFAIP